MINKQEGSRPVVPQAGVGWRMPTPGVHALLPGAGILGGSAQGQVDSCQASGSSQAGRPGSGAAPGVTRSLRPPWFPFPLGGHGADGTLWSVAWPLRAGPPRQGTASWPLWVRRFRFLAPCLVAEGTRMDCGVPGPLGPPLALSGLVPSRAASLASAVGAGLAQGWRT